MSGAPALLVDDAAALEAEQLRDEIAVLQAQKRITARADVRTKVTAMMEARERRLHVLLGWAER